MATPILKKALEAIIASYIAHFRQFLGHLKRNHFHEVEKSTEPKSMLKPEGKTQLQIILVKKSSSLKMQENTRSHSIP